MKNLSRKIIYTHTLLLSYECLLALVLRIPLVSNVKLELPDVHDSVHDSVLAGLHAEEVLHGEAEGLSVDPVRRLSQGRQGLLEHVQVDGEDGADVVCCCYRGFAGEWLVIVRVVAVKGDVHILQDLKVLSLERGS